MPVPINRPPSRPPSNGPPSRPSSSLGGASGTAASLGTTSRRGRGSRARSPAVTSSGSRPVEQNPSSAAAAAAAAAKAYSNGSMHWEIRGDGHVHDKSAYMWHRDSRYYQHDPYYRDERYRRHHDPRRGPPLDYRYTKDKTREGSGTSLVIGGPTPIHVPKMEEKKEDPSMASKRSSVASVFRGRPNDKDEKKKAPVESSSSDKLLLSLGTPSLDERNKGAKSSGLDGTSAFASTSPIDMMDQLQRTPEGSRNSSSIDMAPSFTLFNHSFDSLGDVQLNLDPSLHADSFGLPRTSSVGEANPQIFEAKGAAPFPGPLLAHSASGQLSRTGSGPLTLGYSPVMSFGTASAKAGKGPEMMILGGSDHPSSSPMQMLGMYKSNAGSKEEGRSLKLTTSFLASGPPMPGESTMSFYNLLTKYKMAFRGCTFLLPELKRVLEGVDFDDRDDTSNFYCEEKKSDDDSLSAPTLPQDFRTDPTAEDMRVARRRVESSICAFGGSINSTRKHETNSDDPFRRKKVSYEKALPGRYYENESRLSWELEETPPIVFGEQKDEPIQIESKKNSEKEDKTRSSPTGNVCRPVTGRSDDARSDDESESVSDKKAKYRCKLCGKPKQNHKCPFEQSLARTIGVMVYPAVNAFAADEPGSIAPSLTEMNNFMDSKEEKDKRLSALDSQSSSPSRPSPSRPHSTSPVGNQVTPDSLIRSDVFKGVLQKPPTKRKYDYAAGDNGDQLFVDTMPLKSEQFRRISFSEPLSKKPYTYAPLPLPYAQRKKLSDNLYSLSNKVPKLTDECAVVLREAREKDQWDLAVAELMTQAIVVLHCRDGDHQFNGLKQYLLTLGIAC